MGEGREKSLTGHNNDMVICKMLSVYQFMFWTTVESAIACTEAWIAPIELGRKLEENITESEKEELVNKIGEYAKEWLYKLKISPERKMIDISYRPQSHKRSYPDYEHDRRGM